MARKTSQSTGSNRSGSVRRRLRSLSRYDYVLLLVPLSFVLGYVGAAVTALPWRSALVLGAAVGALVVADALFVHPPMRPPGGDTGRCV